MVVHDKHIILSIVNLQTLAKWQIEFHKQCNFDTADIKAAAHDAGDDYHIAYSS